MALEPANATPLEAYFHNIILLEATERRDAILSGACFCASLALEVANVCLGYFAESVRFPYHGPGARKRYATGGILSQYHAPGSHRMS